MFPSVCQDVHARMSASSFATERASPGLAWYVTCCGVLFERWYLDIEELQTHHIRQFLVTFKRCRVTNIRVQAFRQFTTEGQSYLDELVADGKTAPKAALTRSSTFRIRCGDDGFQQVSFDVQHHSYTGDLHQVRTKEPRVSYTGDNFASLSSVLNKFLFGEMPNSNSFDEFSERLQIVLFALGDLELNAVYNASADVLHVPRELEAMTMEWESLIAKAELAEAMKWYVHHLPKPMKTLTLCESKAVPRWKRVTEGRRPKDRS